MTDTATEERTHRCYPERVNMLRWVASCEDCDYHEAVTRGAPLADGGKLSLEETAKFLVAEHKGQVYVQPGAAPAVTAVELEPGDLFVVTRPLEGANTFRFVALREDKGGKYVDCWEIEKDSKRGYVGVRRRAFRATEIKGRAA